MSEDLLEFLFGLDGLHDGQLDRKALATLGASAGENGAATFGSHTCTEPMRGGTLPLVGLIRTLHVYNLPF